MKKKLPIDKKVNANYSRQIVDAHAQSSSAILENCECKQTNVNICS